MASFAVPCPKVSVLVPASSDSGRKRHRIAPFRQSDSILGASSKSSQFQGCSQRHSNVFKVAAEKTSNSASAPRSIQVKESNDENGIANTPSISAFLKQVIDIVKLVDSRDIAELHMKQKGCELHIKKREALQNPSNTAPAYIPPPPQHTTPPPPQLPPANPPASTSASTRPSTPTPAPSKSKSSHPPFKCPMAGNFYRSPSPGAAPFVKVGDKVQKGQVLCIVEAMKLMNEIEADQAGTIVEILMEDGKPVSIDTPLFIIEP
ncbi:biotin carboxyl carrier protein of acetyl-CoA carboxylase, chloroplastic-like [Andrographis paniculata]|uniref:biotin carboxyl carrier protein of acetyl-CoA carboxylase, chloroplastic-like n=1 Tax=Andrographis paniculata TaxID=175694 RepID=UPI0021E7F117|nr:biotin carboxyl carrier protein of acetyl-CoA carboxylase, chloroplastic-like [Andrographis paniculata]XP_051152569.1 biotin carboxyl carrier protein of acetyl-CoA carboxylase, chloroplastic-like [Andrographis paniculata]